MAERRMLLNNSAEESFIGTMFISYSYVNINKQLNLNLNDNIKIIEQVHYDYNGHYIIGFKKDLIIPEGFIINDVNDALTIIIQCDYNIIFDYNSINLCYNIEFHGNFEFNYNSINSIYINLFDFNYIYNDNCFNVYNNGSIYFNGKTIPQYYNNLNSYRISGHPHIIYDIMKYNGIEEGDEKAKNYRINNNDNKGLIISSSTEYITTKPNVDLGDNNYIKSVNNYMYDGNYITEYRCSSNITHLRKGITLPKDATVYFPDTVTDIDNDFDTENITFSYESNLKKVIIFGNCKLTYLDGFDSSGLENIEIYSDKIIDIKSSCFFNCIKLTQFIIPKSVINIESFAFNSCYELEYITIPDNVEYIGGYNFVSCNNLKNVYIGKKLMNVDSTSFSIPIENITINNNNLEIDKLFYRINTLKNINVNYDNPNYLSINGILFNKNNDSILLYPHSKETTYIIPEGIINIGDYAFIDNPYITCVTIPGSINIVKYGSFIRCSELKIFIIKHGVIGLEQRFFSGSNSKTIEIRMPKTIENLGVFGLHNKIVSIYYEGSIEEYYNINFEETGVSGNLALYNMNLYIQNKLITELTIPNNIILVSDLKCIGHDCITTINVPKSVTRFGYKAFWVGVSTDTIINYEGTEEEWNNIDKSQAFGNRNLILNYLGENVEQPEIPEEEIPTFEGTPPNNQIWYTSTDEEIVEPLGLYKNISLSEQLNIVKNKYYTGLGGVIETDGDIIATGEECFYNKSNLKTITLPDSIIAMITSPFGGCENLISIKIGKNFNGNEGYTSSNIAAGSLNLETIIIDSENTYCYDNNQTSIIRKKDNCLIQGTKNTVIPNTVKKIGYNAFSNIGLINITIPNNVEYIYDYVFSNNTNLTTVVLPNTINLIGEGHFWDCTSLNSINIPTNGEFPGVSIWNTAIWNNEENWYDNGLYWNNTLIYIRNTNGYDKYIIKSGTTTICSNIDEGKLSSGISIKIPNSVQNILDYAFAGSSVTELYYDDVVDVWNTINKSDLWNANSNITVIHCVDEDIQL